VHLCDYLKERDVRNKSVFHFGTGGHHLVGLRNEEDGLENDVLGITACPGEHARYVTKVIENATVGVHYKVLFGDLYNMSAAYLPAFDLVTLFHLGEIEETPSPRRRLDDAGVLELFLGTMSPGGRLFFYTGSWGYLGILPFIERAVASTKMRFQENYKSLSVYRVCSPPE